MASSSNIVKENSSKSKSSYKSKSKKNVEEETLFAPDIVISTKKEKSTRKRQENVEKKIRLDEAKNKMKEDKEKWKKSSSKSSSKSDKSRHSSKEVSSKTQKSSKSTSACEESSVYVQDKIEVTPKKMLVQVLMPHLYSPVSDDESKQVKVRSIFSPISEDEASSVTIKRMRSIFSPISPLKEVPKTVLDPALVQNMQNRYISLSSYLDAFGPILEEPMRGEQYAPMKFPANIVSSSQFTMSSNNKRKLTEESDNYAKRQKIEETFELWF